ncbi:SDR family oxidoreductase [Melittangium boletus DSM 14713]|uniref:SDR family oxidoreductase n=2 Tax=Melittangium boletus TaxID=83453 RepID=A0A250I6Z6_9BACT|nr:SDR family oxidoreductase [Melittangium boletus DSM 14713]
MGKDKGLAVVTGASSGIGAVYAERLAARGHPLLLVARRPDRLARLQEELSREHGVSVKTLVADLESPSGLADVEKRVAADDVALLVNNAGAGGLGKSAEMTADQLERIIKLNITAVTRLSHAALTSFRKRDAGALVNIGSVVAHLPSAGSAVYSASKAYVLNFTRSLQMEYAGRPIRIQLVMPGPIRTEFFSSQGLSDSVFPTEAYLTAEQLVDAALAGLEAGEEVTVPSMPDVRTWNSLETARVAFMKAIMSGEVASRYHLTPQGSRPVRPGA